MLCLFFFNLPRDAQTVKVNWRSAAPFATYKTCAWQDSKNLGMPFYGQWVKADVLVQRNTNGLAPPHHGFGRGRASLRGERRRREVTHEEEYGAGGTDFETV